MAQRAANETALRVPIMTQGEGGGPAVPLAPPGARDYFASMSSDPAKSERLAAALRANLARRKAQARARKDGPAADATDAGSVDARESGTAEPSGNVTIVSKDEAG